MSTKDLGLVTAYGYAKEGGYEGTEAQFKALLGNVANDLAEIESISASAETLTPGSDATATYSSGALALGIPEGLPGRGIVSIAKTAESGAVKTYTITFTDSTTFTFDVTDGEVTDDSLAETLEDYARTDGYYQDMSVGDAEQLVSTIFEEDSTPYLFRTSGGSIGIGDREYDKIVGGTVAWNQLVSSGAVSVTIPSGHKYYALINSVASLGTSDGTAIAITDSTKDMVVDLTLMFGSTIADYIYSLEQATAGAGVAWFKKLGFNKPYYAYNAGELLSVSGLQSHDTVGFNAWDEEWEVGGIDSTTGENTTSSTNIRGKNYCRCVPNTDYYMFVGTTGVGIRFYNADKSYVGYLTWNSVTNKKFTTPTDAYYFRVAGANAYGATYNHDICINLSWDGERDGEYEEYVKHSYALDDSLTLRGIPKLDVNNKLYYDGDEYAPDGTVTRKYGIVDLGEQSWTYNAERAYFQVSIAHKQGADFKAICSKYPVVYWSGSSSQLATADDTTLYFQTSNNNIFIKDSAYSDSTIFTTAMSGQKFVYELATPTTETADAYQNPQIVDDFGTEEYVIDSDIAVPIPVGHNTKYTPNLRAKLEMLPNSPDSDGDYIVRHTSGESAFVLLEKELPSVPSEDGTYVLKCTVSSGTATLTWESEE